MTIIEKINDGIKESMRSKDQVRLGVMRMLKSKILAVDARATLPDADVIKLFKTYCGSLVEAFDQARQVGRSDIADQLQQEIVIVQEFLPYVPSLDETKLLVEQAIKESGAKTKKDLGLVMKATMKLNSEVDGKMAKDIAFSILSD
jgi:hypothetical protein